MLRCHSFLFLVSLLFLLLLPLFFLLFILGVLLQVLDVHTCKVLQVALLTPQTLQAGAIFHAALVTSGKQQGVQVTAHPLGQRLKLFAHALSAAVHLLAAAVTLLMNASASDVEVDAAVVVVPVDQVLTAVGAYASCLHNPRIAILQLKEVFDLYVLVPVRKCYCSLQEAPLPLMKVTHFLQHHVPRLLCPFNSATPALGRRCPFVFRKGTVWVIHVVLVEGHKAGGALVRLKARRFLSSKGAPNAAVQ